MSKRFHVKLELTVGDNHFDNEEYGYIDTPLTISTIREYIKAAAEEYGGQFPYGHPLFSTNIQVSRVRVLKVSGKPA